MAVIFDVMLFLATISNSMKHLLTFTFSLIFIAGSFAQGATLKGFVYDQKTKEPLPYADVKVLGTSPLKAFTTSDEGYFVIEDIPEGTYEVVVEEFFHETFSEEITFKKGKTYSRKFFMEEANVLDGVIIDRTAREDTTRVGISVFKIDKEDILQIPTTGGDADIASYFGVTPGVVSTGDQGGQFYVRGGSPIQNKVLLDGMTVYNPFHSIGFFSVFETEIIQSAEIFTGGFSATHGGRISSIMDIKTRDGNTLGQRGRVSVSPFMAKLLLEGPIKKATEEGDGTISYVLTGKHSYLEQSSKALYSYVNDTAGLPFNFTDIYGKMSFNSRSGSNFNLFGFNFRDQVRYQGISDLSWNSFGVGANWLLVPPGSPVLVGGKLSVSNYLITLQEGELQPDSSQITGFDFGFDFKYFIGENEVKYGIQIGGFSTNYSFFNSVGRQIQQEQFTTELSGYIDATINKGLWVFNPSFRAQYYASLGNFSPEPRLGLKYNFNENFRFKASGGIYSQNLISAASDRDVVNLFYGFLSGPENLQNEFTLPDGSTQEVTHKLQKANHAIAGFEVDVSDNISINVEGYYKWFTQVTNLNRNKIFEDNAENADRPDILKKDLIIETGTAKGVDFVIKYRKDQLYLWAVYSLGKVDRWDGLVNYAPIFDRRHNVNLLGAYTFGKNDDWEINARWNFGSGLPFTPRAGYYHSIDFEDGTSTDITQDNSNELTTIYGDLNTSRLPTYHRLDLTVKKKITFSEYSKLEINAGVTNVYSRQNLFYVIPERNEIINQLPFMPSLSMALTF